MIGSIVKRGKSYSFVHYGYTPNGEYTQIWESGFQSKKDAEQYQRDYNQQLKNTELASVRRITLAKYLSDWLNTYSAQKGLSDNTIRGYKVNIYSHILPSIGNVYISDITATVLDKLFADLTAKGLSGTSQRYVYRVLHKAFETGIKRRELQYNYCDMIEPPKLNKFDSNYIETSKYHVLLSFLDTYDIRFSLPICFAFLLGLRRGEVIGLKWSDIDFEQKTIFVQRTATPIKGGYKFSACKTEKSVRLLSIPNFLFSLIIRWKKIQNSYDIQNVEDFIFAQSNDKLFSATTLNKRYKKVLSDCGIDTKTRFHDLRHSFASFLVSESVPINTVSQMLGHSRISTTVDIYTHTDVKMQKLAIEKLNDISSFG